MIIKKLVTIILFFGISFGQQPIDYESLVNRNGLHYLKFTNELFSGPVFNIDGKKYNKGYINKGKFDGPITTYYRKGQLRSEINFKDGKVVSFKSYKRNGKLKKERKLKKKLKKIKF